MTLPRDILGEIIFNVKKKVVGGQVMSFPVIWPKELVIHYFRINGTLREEFLGKVKSTTFDRDDNLRRFLLVMHKYEDRLDQYKDYPEFVFFILQGLFYEGKSSKVLSICSDYTNHPGILLLKVQLLITSRQFDEVPDLLAKIKELTRDIEPVLHLSALAYDILFSYYSQSLSDIPLKITELESVYEQLKEFATGNSLLQKLLLQEYINGLSVNIAMHRRNGELVQGADAGKKLITQAREFNNRYLMNRLLNNTALCLIEIGHLKEGLIFLEEAFEFSRILANEIRIASFANNIGFIYRQMIIQQLLVGIVFQQLHAIKYKSMIHRLLVHQL